MSPVTAGELCISAVACKALIDLFCRSPLVWWLRDRAGIILEVSPNCERVVGVSEEQLLGRTGHAVIDEYTSNAMRRLSERALAGHRAEDLISTPDNRQWWVSVQTTPIDGILFSMAHELRGPDEN